MNEAELAWDLAQFADPHLDAVERNDIYIAIGLGESFTAIRGLIKAVDHARLTLPHELVMRCPAWAALYRGNEYEPQIRKFIRTIQRPARR